MKNLWEENDIIMILIWCVGNCLVHVCWQSRHLNNGRFCIAVQILKKIICVCVNDRPWIQNGLNFSIFRAFDSIQNNCLCVVGRWARLNEAAVLWNFDEFFSRCNYWWRLRLNHNFRLCRLLFNNRYWLWLYGLGKINLKFTSHHVVIHALLHWLFLLCIAVSDIAFIHFLEKSQKFKSSFRQTTSITQTCNVNEQSKYFRFASAPFALGSV